MTKTRLTLTSSLKGEPSVDISKIVSIFDLDICVKVFYCILATEILAIRQRKETSHIFELMTLLVPIINIQKACNY